MLQSSFASSGKKNSSLKPKLTVIPVEDKPREKMRALALLHKSICFRYTSSKTDFSSTDQSKEKLRILVLPDEYACAKQEVFLCTVEDRKAFAEGI